VMSVLMMEMFSITVVQLLAPPLPNIMDTQ